jgi:hypothetical protein
MMQRENLTALKKPIQKSLKIMFGILCVSRMIYREILGWKESSNLEVVD